MRKKEHQITFLNHMKIQCSLDQINFTLLFESNFYFIISHIRIVLINFDNH